MITNCSMFNTNRMVEDYTRKFYSSANRLYYKLSADNFKKSKELSSWKYKIDTSWSQVKVDSVNSEMKKDMHKGEELNVNASVELGNLKSDDVAVSIYYGLLNSDGEITKPRVSVMTVKGHHGSTVNYEGSIKCDEAGQFGFVVRVMANNNDLASINHYGKVVWG
jgi:glycogen phosphorylase